MDGERRAQTGGCEDLARQMNWFLVFLLVTELGVVVKGLLMLREAGEGYGYF